MLKKSNPPLLEWLNSPIVYQKKFGITERIKQLLPAYYSPIACLYHYLHMVQGNYREYLKGDIVRVKKYFYALRPLLAIKWIETVDVVVPMEFAVLVERTISDQALKSAIADLVARKKSGCELDRGPAIPLISDFIRTELERIEKISGAGKAAEITMEPLNEVFRAALIEAWATHKGV